MTEKENKERISRLTARASTAARTAATASTEAKNSALEQMAAILTGNTDRIEEANRADMREAEKKGITGPLLKRLLFDRPKIEGRVRSLRKIAALPDPVGQLFDVRKLENGLDAARMRIPLGVILMIYEARPHVTINSGAFALKAGNAIICKGGSEAKRCNELLGELWAEALSRAGLPQNTVEIVSLSHAEVDELLTRQDEIDLVIPRGGKELIRIVSEKSKIPVIKHYEGNCHIYLDRDADREKAVPIVLDSKLLMPAVCNAAEKILVHEALLDWLPELLEILRSKGIEVRGCPKTVEKVPGTKEATGEDWKTEYLDLVYAVKVVSGVEDASKHIRENGSEHTEVIVTENYSRARSFLRLVNSSVVLVNASTMFCDGETLGMGAEIGISTGRLHARGPMGLKELTTYKHVIQGDGQVMGG